MSLQAPGYVDDDEPEYDPMAEQLTGGGDDGGEEERATAVSRLRERILTGDQVKTIPARRSLIKGYLDLDTLGLLFGRPGSAKSFFAIDMALHVAIGAWWHGHRVRGGDVLYIVAEGAAGISNRQTAWELQNNMHGEIDRMHWLPVAVNLLDSVDATALATVAEELAPRLVVIDTLARSMLGGDENTGKDMTRVIANADLIRQRTGACVLIVHHSGKDQSAGARGWSGLFGAVDTELELKAAEGIRTLTTTKQKDAIELPPIQFTLAGHKWACPDCGGNSKIDGEDCERCDGSGQVGSAAVARYTGGPTGAELSTKTQEALNALESIDLPGGVSAGDWKVAAADMGVSPASFARARKRLLADGLVRQIGKTKYAVAGERLALGGDNG